MREKRLPSMERALIPGIALAVAAYAGFAIWADVREVRAALSGFEWWRLAAAFGLAAGNYGLRFVRWDLYLRSTGIAVARGRSLLIFLAGFSMTVSPGKVGEVVKSYLLLRADAVPIEKSAPLVVAERLTDLLALLVLIAMGMTQSFVLPAGALGGRGGEAAVGLLGAAVLCVGGTLMLSNRRLMRAGLAAVGRVPRMRALAARLREGAEAMWTVLRPGPLVAAVLLGAVAWLLEGLALHVIVGGMPSGAPAVAAVVFIYSVTTLLGAVSFLPGGIGVTEASMGLLLVSMGMCAGEGEAVAATYLVRLATLWFAVGIGVWALWWVRGATRDGAGEAGS